MSDAMLLGVLRMPYELTMSDDLSRAQFHQRAQQAADRIESDADRIAALEAENEALKSGWKAQRELRDAVWNLMQMKGRHNTEISYRRLEAIYLKAVKESPILARSTSSAPETWRPSSADQQMEYPVRDRTAR